MMDWQLAARGETGFDDDTAAACSRILRQCLRVGEKSRIGEMEMERLYRKMEKRMDFVLNCNHVE